MANHPKWSRFSTGSVSAKLLPVVLTAALSLLVGSLIAMADQLAWFEWTTSQGLLFFLLLFSCLLPFVVAVVRGRLDVFEPIYMFAFVFLMAFVLASLIMTWEDYVDRSGVSYRSELSAASFIAWAGLVGTYLGYVWGRAWLAPRLLARVAPWLPQDDDVEGGYVFRFSVIGLILTGFLFFQWIVIADIPLSALNALEEGVSYTTAGAMARNNIIYLWSFRYAWPLLILLAWSYAPSRFWKLIIGAAWFVNLVIYATAANRTTLFSLLVATMVLSYLRRKTRPSLVILAILLVFTMVVSGFLVSNRGRSRLDISVEQLVAIARREVTDSGALSGLMNVTYVFPERSRFLGAAVFSDVIYAPIPRTLWPNKPSLRPVQDVLNVYLPVELAHAPGALGIYYAGFGIAGAFTILFLYGTLSSLVYRIWFHNPESPLAGVLLAGWLPFVWVMIHRGVASMLLVRLLYTFGSVLLAWLLGVQAAKRHRRRMYG